VGAKLIIGTRGSKLALWQAGFVAERLRRAYPDLTLEIKRIATTGDKILDAPLARIGGKGLFTKELEAALLAKEADLAVHSLKDFPTVFPPGLVLAAVTERDDPGDALVSPRYGRIENLPPGARIGTSSLRRRAQLLFCRPDLTVVELRGNVDTRLAKLSAAGLDGVVLAVAGLRRLGRADAITQILPPEICLPAAGQGALAVEARAGDEATLALLACLDHAPTRRAAAAERAFLAVLGGGCQVPVGVHGKVAGTRLELEAAILSPDGRRRVHDRVIGDAGAAADLRTAEELGRSLAERLLLAGGREILAEIGVSPEEEEA